MLMNKEMTFAAKFAPRFLVPLGFGGSAQAFVERFPSRSCESLTAALHYARMRKSPEPLGAESVTVHVQGGSATFERVDPTHATLSIKNTIQAGTMVASNPEDLQSNLQAMCRAEIAQHEQVFHALLAELTKVLSHDGKGTKVASNQQVRFERGWRHRDGMLTVQGADFTATSNLATNDPETSSGALVEAEVRNVLQARVRGIRNLYQRIQERSVAACAS